MFTLKLERIHTVYPDARQSPTAVKLQVQPEQLEIFTKGTEHQVKKFLYGVPPANTILSHYNYTHCAAGIPLSPRKSPTDDLGKVCLLACL